MNAITDRTMITAIMGAFTTTGTKAPKAVAEAHTHLEETRVRFAHQPAPDPEGLALAVLAAIDAGTDPASSPAVQAVITAQALSARHGLEGEVQAILTGRLRTTITQHVDDITTAWSPAFDRAATELASAYEVLGDIDLTDTETVVRQGPAATASWSAAQRSVGLLDTVAAAWSALVTLATGTMPAKRYRLLHVAEVAPDAWLDLALDDAKANAWAGLGHGLPLRLPTIDEHRASVAAIEHERHDRTQLEDVHRHDTMTGRRVGGVLA